jgi:iron complex outermembrane receptor protein
MKLRISLLSLHVTAALALPNVVFAENSSTTSDDELLSIQIEGRALSYYQADAASLATRTETSIDETPQSIQVITESLIEDQAALEISDLYRSISGVSYNNFSTVTMRGFSQDEILYDGMKGDPFEGFSIPQLFTIEQIQVLKGPSGALYGAGEPGGVINYVTKKPTYEQVNKIEVGVGNKDFFSGSVESSGALTEDGSQRYRVGIYSDTQGSYRNNVEEQNQTIDLGYAWDINDDTTLNLQYTNIFQHIDGARLRGIPTDDDGNFLADTSWNNNEASDYQELEAQVFQAGLQHSFTSWLDSNFTVRAFENKETQNYHEISALVDTDGDGVYDETKRQYRDQTWENKGVSFASNFIAELGTHTLVMGADYYYNEEDYIYYRATGESDGVSNLSLTDPDYGQDDVSDYNMSLNKSENTVLNQIGAYVQDQWDITQKLSLLASGRLDYIAEKFTDYTDSDANADYDDLGYSTRLGATYDLSERLKPYTSFSTGFVPQSASDQQTSEDGSLFEPEESQQFEVGVRTHFLDKKLNVNFALYHIERKNMLTEDPDDDDYNVAIGKVTSKGIEIDMLADITDRLVANVSYAYNHLEVSETDDDARNLANTPRHQLGIWTRYAFPSIDSSIAVGADYVSEQRNRSDQVVKSYAVYDASWQTVWKDWKFQLNIKNLFDKEYAIAGFTETIGSYVGERRRVYFNTAYNF